MFLARRLPSFCWTAFRITTVTSGYSTVGEDGTVKDASIASSDHKQLEVYSGPLPRDKLTVTYSRSSGPGGQNVNKVNSKTEVRFHIDSANWIPTRVKDRLKSMFKGRVTKQGELVVVSQKHRSQRMNLNEAVAKMEEMLLQASEMPKGPSQLTVTRVRTLKRKAERKRLADKKYHSQMKQYRRIV